MKSLLYNFNFLQGLIPWSVVAQALNPFAQSLGRRTAAAPDLAGLREAPSAPSSSSTPHEHPPAHWHLKCCSPLPGKPTPGVWVGGTARKRLQAEKTAWWENPGSLVLIPITAVHTGISCTSWLDSALNPKGFSFLFLFGWCSRRKVCMYVFVKDSLRAQEF